MSPVDDRRRSVGVPSTGRSPRSGLGVEGGRRPRCAGPAMLDFGGLGCWRQRKGTKGNNPFYCSHTTTIVYCSRRSLFDLLYRRVPRGFRLYSGPSPGTPRSTPHPGCLGWTTPTSSESSRTRSGPHCPINTSVEAPEPTLPGPRDGPLIGGIRRTRTITPQTH